MQRSTQLNMLKKQNKQKGQYSYGGLFGLCLDERNVSNAAQLKKELQLRLPLSLSFPKSEHTWLKTMLDQQPGNKTWLCGLTIVLAQSLQTERNGFMAFV